MNKPLHHLSLCELKDQLANNRVSASEIAQHFQNRIFNEQKESTLNCFINTKALAGEVNHQPLSGLPIAHKDIFCTKGTTTTCGSKMLQDYVPPFSATATSRLARAGAICLAKCNMDEFAMGSSNETSYFGPVKNPWDITCVPGGSSGGSAAAVAARLIPAATGTDTGGSIRQPASHCGVSGIKPTYGRISRYGQIAFASSLDQAGVFATTAEDLALLLNVLCGYDEFDNTTARRSVPDFMQDLNYPVHKRRIGFSESYLRDSLPEVAKIIEAALLEFEKNGAILVPIKLESHQLAVSVYQILASAECSSNLSRYDGIRYGHRSTNAPSTLDLITNSRSEGFGTEVKRRILLGSYVLSAGYYDAFYVKAKKLQQTIRSEFQEAFEHVDVIATPTAPTPAFKIGEKNHDPLAMYLSDVLTVSVNLAELPALSIPAGFCNTLPVGLQLIAPWFEEGRILNLSHQFQQFTDYHLAIPEDYQ